MIALGTLLPSSTCLAVLLLLSNYSAGNAAISGGKRAAAARDGGVPRGANQCLSSMPSHRARHERSLIIDTEGTLVIDNYPVNSTEAYAGIAIDDFH